MLEHERPGGGGRPSAESSSTDVELVREYVAFLREERGLSERSVMVYRPLVRAFVAHGGRGTGRAFPTGLDAHGVRAFLLGKVARRSASYAHLLASALRSFLGFLFLRGRTAQDLSLSVPPVRRCRPAPLPSFPGPAEVERMLGTPDLSTSKGRRDRAILLLLARLGVRAGEIVTLELGDLRWRAGEIVVRGKGRSVNRLPLPADVGRAIAVYLRRDRGETTSRRVFLSRRAPHAGLTGPAAVGHVVRQALARAGLPSPWHRGAAHLFRHGLASRMVSRGASLGEIAEVLRHRSPATTEIYAHVAVEVLREVARPWPKKAGGR